MTYVPRPTFVPVPTSPHPNVYYVHWYIPVFIGTYLRTQVHTLYTVTYLHIYIVHTNVHLYTLCTLVLIYHHWYITIYNFIGTYVHRYTQLNICP